MRENLGGYPVANKYIRIEPEGYAQRAPTF